MSSSSSSSSDDNKIAFKVITVGEYGAGKTAFLARFGRDEFPQFRSLSRLTDFVIKTVEREGKQVKLLLMDTVGVERFGTLTPSYYRCGQAVFFVFDTTSAVSFQKLSFWFDEVESRCPQDIPKLLIGTKSELSNKREVSQTEIDALCAQRDITYFEVSSKDSINVDQAFQQMITLLLERYARDHSDPAPVPSIFSFNMMLGQNGTGCYC